MTVAVGSIVVIIVAEAEFFAKQSDEFFFFAGLIGLVSVLFVYLAMKYVYVDVSGRVESEADCAGYTPSVSRF